MVGGSFPSRDAADFAVGPNVKKMLLSCNDQNIVRATDIQWIVDPPPWRETIISGASEFSEFG
jgi:hypothetical protein